MNDKIVEAVRADLLRRSNRGIQKYNVTLDREDLSLLEWLQHTYEEVLDQANYLKKTILLLKGSEFLCSQPQNLRCTAQCEKCKKIEDEIRITD